MNAVDTTAMKLQANCSLTGSWFAVLSTVFKLHWNCSLAVALQSVCLKRLHLPKNIPHWQASLMCPSWCRLRTLFLVSFHWCLNLPKGNKKIIQNLITIRLTSLSIFLAHLSNRQHNKFILRVKFSQSNLCFRLMNKIKWRNLTVATCYAKGRGFDLCSVHLCTWTCLVALDLI
jgi:hypothetical protein